MDRGYANEPKFIYLHERFPRYVAAIDSSWSISFAAILCILGITVVYLRRSSRSLNEASEDAPSIDCFHLHVADYHDL